MQPIHDGLVYIVDDDAGVRDALSWLLRSRRLMSETYDSADGCTNGTTRCQPSRSTPTSDGGVTSSSGPSNGTAAP